MAEKYPSPGAGTRTAGDDFLQNIASEADREMGNRAPASTPGHELLRLLNFDRCVGDLISMDYETAEVLIHDRLRQDVGGVPHGCLLLATRIKTDGAPPGPEEDGAFLLLLRALKSSPLPNDIEMKQARLLAGQRAAQTPDTWDQEDKTDLLTLDQMRYAGAHCRIMGTFRMERDEETGKWRMAFGGDIDNFYAGQGMKVYKPAGAALKTIANYRKHETIDNSAPVPIGKLRYAAAIRDQNAAEAVPVSMMPGDLVARRTALFGMTRTGKSNTTKTIASAIFKLRTQKNGQKVGQLIFDPNGEYANENPQDKGCLRNIALGISEGDVLTYGLHPHPNDPSRELTKFNFFGDTSQSLANKSQDEIREILHSLYQGKQLINEVLEEEGSGYVKNFVSTEIEAPSDMKPGSSLTRYQRAVFVYRGILAVAGFKVPRADAHVKSLFSEELREKMCTDKNSQLEQYAKQLERGKMSWDQAGNFCRHFARWINTDTFITFNENYAKSHRGRNWLDGTVSGLLQIFGGSRGLNIIKQAVQWHDLDSNTDYAKDIVEHVQAGRLVILDQAIGSPEMNKQAAARIVRGIFAAQQRKFTDPERDPNTGDYKKPPAVIIYAEEAHTLLPKGAEKDTTNIWARVAKEGAKFNIGLVYSTQEPSSIQTNILKNTENWFIAHLNNADETRELAKYNDFSDFTNSIIKVNETGFLRVRTLSSPYTLPVQIDKFTAPLPEKQES